MFWNRNNKQDPVADVTTAIVVEEPQPVQVSPDPNLVGEEFQEYARVAKEVGFTTNGAFLQQRLLRFFSENGICVCLYAKVETYLDSKFGKARSSYGSTDTSERTWGWRPLRPQDIKEVSFDPGIGRNGEFLTRNGSYMREVPLPVLLTVAKISKEFPEIHFYVSDQITARDRTDPFLMVTATGVDLLVIERWNEPSFRM